MINLFSPSENDQSIYYLGQIFGPVGTVLQPDQSASLILGTMFRYFNSVILSVAALIVLYVTIVGVIKTANEGEFLGKEWNGPWIPIRMVLGIAALVPSASGYCAMQIITMWIIVQGIGAADTIWTTVLNYTNIAGSPTSAVNMPQVGVKGNFQTMYQSLVCQATAHANYQYTSPGGSKGGYYCATQKDAFCQASYSDLLNLKGPQGKAITQKDSGGQTNYLWQYSFGPQASCGTMTIEDAEKACQNTSSTEGQIQCSTAKAQQESLQATLQVFGNIAAQFTSGDYQYRRFFDLHEKPPSWVTNFCSSNGWSEDQCCYSSQSSQSTTQQQACEIPPSLNSGDYFNAAQDTVTQVYWPYYMKPNVVGDIDFISASLNNYSTSINNAIASAVDTASNTATNSLSGVLSEAQKVGWIFAGAYYYYLAGQNKGAVSASNPTFTMSQQLPNSGSGPLKDLRNNYIASGYMLSSASTTKSTLSLSAPTQLQGLDQLSDGITSTTISMTDSFMNTITGASPGTVAKNPLIALTALGQSLLIIGQLLFALTLIILPFLSLGYINPMVLGTGLTSPILGPALSTLLMFFVPAYTLLVGSLFLFGALLGVYTPLIPYIVFTMAVVGWFILVIEAMVAAPLVALGILVPGGGHPILGKASAALYYLFGIFLRPGLMVFGMISAMLLAMVVVTMINAGFAGVMTSLYTVGQTPAGTVVGGLSAAGAGGGSGSYQSGVGPGLVELIIFATIYVALILASLNKAFALIYIIPDRVLRWIGGQPEQTDVAEALREAERAAGAGAGAAQAGGKEIAKIWGDKFSGMKKGGGPQAPTPTLSTPPTKPPEKPGT